MRNTFGTLFTLTTVSYTHLDVYKRQASYKMSQQNALLLCDDSRSHCRSEVINNDNDICRMLLKIALEGRHNLTRKLIEVNAVDTQDVYKRQRQEHQSCQLSARTEVYQDDGGTCSGRQDKDRLPAV